MNAHILHIVAQNLVTKNVPFCPSLSSKKFHSNFNGPIFGKNGGQKGTFLIHFLYAGKEENASNEILPPAQFIPVFGTLSMFNIFATGESTPAFIKINNRHNLRTS